MFVTRGSCQITLSSLSGPSEASHVDRNITAHVSETFCCIVITWCQFQQNQYSSHVMIFEALKVSENNLFTRQVSVILWKFKGAHVMLVRVWLEAESGPTCRITDGLRGNMNKQTGKKRNVNYMDVAWLKERNRTDYSIERRTNHMANTQTI